MKIVLYGETAIGKTRQCVKLAKKFNEDGLIVTSNIPDINEKRVRVVNPKKKQSVFDYSYILEKLYNQDTMEEYPTFKYPRISFPVIKECIEYMMCDGDVLILDDIDNTIPYLVLDLMMCYLCDNMDGNWKHVIVAGYSLYLRSLLNSSDDKVYFVEDNGNIVGVEGSDNINEKYLEVANA